MIKATAVSSGRPKGDPSAGVKPGVRVAPLRRILLKVLVFVLIFPLTALAFALGLIWIPYKLFVSAIARLVRPDLVGSVTGLYNTLFAAPPEHPLTAALCHSLIFDGKLSVDELRARFQEKILNVRLVDGRRKYERLMLRPFKLFGYYFLRRVDSFSLTDHIRSYDYRGSGLALPRGRPLEERDLVEITGALSTMPWPSDRSDWEMLIIDNYSAGGGSVSGESGQSVLVVRWSHAVCDGYGMLSIMCQLTDDPAVESVVEPLEKPRPVWSNISVTLRDYLHMLWDFADAILVGLASFNGEWTVPRGGQPQVIITALSPGIPVEKIKMIRKKYGVKYSSVLFAVVSRALSRLFAMAGEPVPPALYCVFPVPRPNHPGTPLNHFYGGIMELPLGSAEENDTAALRVMDERLSNAAGSVVKITDFYLSLLVLLPIPFIEWFGKILRPGIGIGVMPTILRRGFICGKLVMDFLPFIVTVAPPTMNGEHPMEFRLSCMGKTAMEFRINLFGWILVLLVKGVSVCMSGVNGIQRVGVTMVRSLFPHPKTLRRLGSYIEEEFEKLYTMNHGL